MELGMLRLVVSTVTTGFSRCVDKCWSLGHMYGICAADSDSLRAERPGVWSSVGGARFYAHLASCTVGTGGKAAVAWRLPPTLIWPCGVGIYLYYPLCPLGMLRDHLYVYSNLCFNVVLVVENSVCVCGDDCRVLRFYLVLSVLSTGAKQLVK